MAKARTGKARSSSRRARSSPGGVAQAKEFTALAQAAIEKTARPLAALDEILKPLDAFADRHKPKPNPDPRFENYAREFSAVHLDATTRLGHYLREGALVAFDRFGSWHDLDAGVLAAPRLRVYVPDRPGTTSPPDLRYTLSWTTMLPDFNEYDPFYKVSRWRAQNAEARITDGTCVAGFSTNGDTTDVQAGVGIKFQPTASRGTFQFRPLVIWRTWTSLETDPPPFTAPPYPLASARSHAWVRLVAQSWRAADHGDFRTDATLSINLVDYAIATPNRFHGQEESGIANPSPANWLELPADKTRVYALWAILRGWSHSTYAHPSLSSAIASGMCSVPFMIVEHVP
ncbi:MAG: hypothetical protein U0Q12_24740 [Vicinamibacterales bacterium]